MTFLSSTKKGSTVLGSALCELMEKPLAPVHSARTEAPCCQPVLVCTCKQHYHCSPRPRRQEQPQLFANRDRLALFVA